METSRADQRAPVRSWAAEPPVDDGGVVRALRALIDRSHAPHHCPHRIAASIEAWILAARQA